MAISGLLRYLTIDEVPFQHSSFELERRAHEGARLVRADETTSSRSSSCS